MSCIRQNYDDGHDIASATENGEACDFSKEMPKTTTPESPSVAMPNVCCVPSSGFRDDKAGQLDLKTDKKGEKMNETARKIDQGEQRSRSLLQSPKVQVS